MLKNLKQLRKNSGISQQQLARILGVSQQSINKYENHNVEPDIATMIAMADHFGCTVDYLVGRSNIISEPTKPLCTLSQSEIALIRDYRVLNDTEKACISTLIKTYKEMKN